MIKIHENNSTIVVGILAFAATLSSYTPANAAQEYKATGSIDQPHQSPCLDAWPHIQTLTGHLVGIYYKAVTQENPPIPARVSMYLQLDKPISTCAALVAWTPAHENVTRVGLGWASNADYSFIMKRWGKQQIRISGSFLQSGMGSGGQPGLLVFWDIRQFCSSHENNVDHVCMSWNTWTATILKNGQPHMCAGGQSTRPGSRDWVTRNPNALGYTPFAIAHGAIGVYSTGQSKMAIFPSAEVGHSAAIALYQSPPFRNEPTLLAVLQRFTNLLPPLTDTTPRCSAAINAILNFE